VSFEKRASLIILLFLLPACGDSDAGDDGSGASQGSGGSQLECDDGWADCNGDAADGCEASLQISSEHCGACGASCHGGPHVGSAMCAEGVCVMVGCEPGWEDCNLSPDDGCETDVSSDADNCGACGNVCASDGPQVAGAASCTDNACVLSCATGFGDCDPEAAGCETDLGSTDESCGVCGYDCGPGGCDAGACAPVAIVTSAGEPFDLALAGDELYWADTSGSIRRVDVGSLATDVVWSGEVSPASLAVSDDWIFWSTWSQNAIRRGKRDGSGGPQTLCGPSMADSVNPMGLAFDGQFLLWVDFGAPAGGMPAIHAWVESPSPLCIKLHEDVVPFTDVALTPFGDWYWTQVDPVAVSGTIKNGPLPVPSYVAETTTSDPDVPAFVALDPTHVYWTTLNGKLKRAPLGETGNSETIYQTSSANEPSALGIALDSKYIYFAADTLGGPVQGTIYRLRKP